MTLFIISFIRTIAPAIVGALGSWLVTLGLDVGEEALASLTAFMFIAFTGIYYALVRLLEEKYPKLGILLGFAKSPDSYSKGPGVELTQKPGGNPEVTITVEDGSMVPPSRLTSGPDHRA